ncbi:MAG TPA: hypothetical protein VK324_00095 [Tepidisphaeraceae bacterium]|nr:hypothetical protein [Tepidisphaeraceae bacterium]
MTGMSIDVREMVRQSVADEWPGFAERHPRLAAVLDEPLVVRQAMQCLEDDPEYRDALARAAAAGMAAEALGELVRRCVGRWLRQLAAP